MSSERTVRRRVSEQKKLFYGEVTECLNKFSDICQNVTLDNTDALNEIEESEPHDEIPSVNPALNSMCLMKTLCTGKNTSLDQLIANQFKRRVDEVVEEEVPVEKNILDINLPKHHATALDEALGINDEDKKDTDKNLHLKDFLQNYSHEESDEEAENCAEEDLEYLLLDENDDKAKFINEIRELCLKYVHKISHEFIQELIKKLRKETGAPFPETARTFLRTPRNVNTRKMGSGEYCHYGLESALKLFIDTYIRKGIDVDCIKLLVGIDGAPLANSSEKGLWIIACSENTLKLVEVLGIYHGEDKPDDVNEFLKEFKEEITHFINNGIEHQGKHYSVLFEELVCDAPAKSFVLCVKYHSGYYSCTKCTIEGEYHGAVHFPGPISTLRTDEKVKGRKYDDSLGDDYQKNGETILKDIPKFGLVTNVVLDYMHLICLGVMLKLIEIWIKSAELDESDIDRISERLNDLKDFVPSDFCRNPRQFRKIRRLWKATELRQFLLYTGPVVLLNILPTKLYIHFLYLHIAVSILVNPILCKNEDYLNFADQLLKNFVNDFEVHYGRRNVTFNVHNLLHIVPDARRFGPLDDFSAFRFENLIRKIKQLVRNGNQPLKQIWKRLAEIRSCKVYSDDNDVKFDLSVYRPMQEIHVFKKDSIIVDCRNESNSCVLLSNGNYLQCHYFMKTENSNVKVIGNVLKVVDSFYKEHLKDASDKLHIKIVRETETRQPTAYSVELILAKVCKFPLKANNYFVVIPLIHTYVQ